MKFTMISLLAATTSAGNIKVKHPLDDLFKVPQKAGNLLSQKFEQELYGISKMTSALEPYENFIGCGLCQAVFKPLDIVLESAIFDDIGEFFADLICKHYKIYGGI